MMIDDCKHNNNYEDKDIKRNIIYTNTCRHQFLSINPNNVMQSNSNCLYCSFYFWNYFGPSYGSEQGSVWLVCIKM